MRRFRLCRRAVLRRIVGVLAQALDQIVAVAGLGAHQYPPAHARRPVTRRVGL
jgi:hypothetical protein